MSLEEAHHHRRPWIRAWRKKEMNEGRGREEHEILCSKRALKSENLVEEKDKKVKELQDNIAAVNFTPQSKMGEMLMAKCTTLVEENEEIGNQASEGKMHELEMKISMQKYQNAELRSQFEGWLLRLKNHMDGLTNDVDKSNEMVKKRVVDPKTSQSTRKIKHPNSLLGVVHVLVSKSKVNVIDVVGRFPDDDTNDIDDYRQGMI
ncbi:FKBP12-interacting protein of 37 kDa [Glycine soja]|uniref:FKBP12-interacting protein of 37 kDa n=1 Tax=Glycine soja TaxID=3848 RepID=A0A445L0I3_GLYSO|nr:FKBP12-interacting protein of 37 kDa [Glycine soja]